MQGREEYMNIGSQFANSRGYDQARHCGKKMAQRDRSPLGTRLMPGSLRHHALKYRTSFVALATPSATVAAANSDAA